MTCLIDDFQMVGSANSKIEFDDLMMLPLSEEWINKILEILRIEKKMQDRVIRRVLLEEEKCSQTATGNT